MPVVISTALVVLAAATPEQEAGGRHDAVVGAEHACRGATPTR